MSIILCIPLQFDGVCGRPYVTIGLIVRNSAIPPIISATSTAGLPGTRNTYSGMSCLVFPQVQIVRAHVSRTSRAIGVRVVQHGEEEGVKGRADLATGKSLHHVCIGTHELSVSRS